MTLQTLNNGKVFLPKTYDRDYFQERQVLEPRFFNMVLQWLNYLEMGGVNKIRSVVDVGCSTGLYLRAIKYIDSDIKLQGYDYYFESARPFTHPEIVDEITTDWIQVQPSDLALCLDTLEHIPIEQVDAFVDRLASVAGKFLILSICMVNELGTDPNYALDPTHVTLRTKPWWRHQFAKRGLKEIPVPKHFLFWPQLLFFEVGSK